jgi:5-formyltetrahydrofolate cyclo-ligase
MIHEALAAGKRVGLPVTLMEERRLEFREVGDLDHDLEVRGSFNIPEPREHCRAIAPQSADLVLVPGLGFDRRGYRVGYGGGFYDRFLSTLPGAATAGLCFDLQVVEAVPTAPGDVPVEWLITDRRLIRCQRSEAEAS